MKLWSADYSIHLWKQRKKKDLATITSTFSDIPLPRYFFPFYALFSSILLCMITCKRKYLLLRCIWHKYAVFLLWRLFWVQLYLVFVFRASFLWTLLCIALLTSKLLPYMTAQTIHKILETLILWPISMKSLSILIQTLKSQFCS